MTATPIIGRRVAGNYTIVSLLGRGGMGAVYAAQHDILDEKLAIKVLHPQFAHNAEMVRRFQAEARAASATKHPNIIRVHDCGRFDSGENYIALEYLDGHSLDEEPTPMALEPLLLITIQVCAGLSAAHARGIIHRDLKPANLFLSPQPQGPYHTKILDFGIAKLLGDAAVSGLHTHTHVIMGTPAYMSSEQARGSAHVTVLSDIWSLGAILYELTTGALPYQGASIGELVVAHLIQPVPDPGALRPDLPAGWRRIIRAALSVEPEERPQSATDLAELLIAATPRGAELATTLGWISTGTAELPVAPRNTVTHAGDAAPAAPARSTTLSAAAGQTRELEPPPPLSQSKPPWRLAAAVVLTLAVVGAGVALVKSISSGPAPSASQSAAAVDAGVHADTVVDAGATSSAGARPVKVARRAADAAPDASLKASGKRAARRRDDDKTAPTTHTRRNDNARRPKQTPRKPRRKRDPWVVPDEDGTFGLKKRRP